jgi:hypothetical protein
MSNEKEVGLVSTELLNKTITPPKKCPHCGAEDVKWETGALVQVVNYTEGRPISAGIIPLVPIVCPQCAYFLFFSAVKLGLVDAKTGAVK